MMRVAVIVPAGGAGSRMGGVLKPFLLLAGEPVLARCLQPFLDRSDVVRIVVALPAALHAAPPAWLGADDRVTTVAGGAERGDSVRSALAVVPPDADIVLVHDAARPLVAPDIIERCIAAAAAGRSVIAAVPVTDTVKVVDDDGVILDTPDRSRLRAAQTPQAFPAAVLRAAYEQAARDGISATDDAALVARTGVPVGTVYGAPENLKITTAADLAIAEALLSRTGHAAPGVQ
jgi:2-C-methyl-D-erythritol 4-phosphate cytidylyltransferase